MLKPLSVSLSLALLLSQQTLAQSTPQLPNPQSPNPRLPNEPLVTDATIKLQKDLTTTFKLDNGIPVIIRTIEGSDLLQLSLSFTSGIKDLPSGKKALNEWYWMVAPMAGVGFPKEKIYAESEKYGIAIDCNGGIDLSACGLGTLNEYWDKALPLFSAIINKPALDEADIKLSRDRLIAKYKATPSDPESYVNEVVNSVYYEPGHPYRLNHDEALKEMENLGKRDLEELSKKNLNAQIMSFVVVSSMPPKKIVSDLNKAFGKIPKAEPKTVTPQQPRFDPDKAYSFNDRELPTAYIRVKLGTVGLNHPDAMAARLLFEILNEELGDEIRTKRSLSYAAHSYTIQYSIGIGVLTASTSKPKETLEAMNEVIHKLKSRTFSVEELEEYKHGFATNYFLTLETHASLAGALASSHYYYKDSDTLYDLPRALDKVTPVDIKRLANELLVDMRVGVIFGRKDFEDKWAQDFIRANQRDQRADATGTKSDQTNKTL